MKPPVIDNQEICIYCDQDHKKEGLATFEGAYGVYCIPQKKLNGFKGRLKKSQKFRKYLSLDEIPEDELLDAEKSVSLKNSFGGTSPKQVIKQLKQL